jgi:hypothetical protein
VNHRSDSRLSKSRTTSLVLLLIQNSNLVEILSTKYLVTTLKRWLLLYPPRFVEARLRCVATQDSVACLMQNFFRPVADCTGGFGEIIPTSAAAAVSAAKIHCSCNPSCARCRARVRRATRLFQFAGDTPATTVILGCGCAAVWTLAGITDPSYN